MSEALIVLGLLALLVALGVLATSVTWTVLVLAGMSVVAVGFVVGVPAGAYYHVALHRCLGPRGVLPRGWYWSPVKHHAHLDSNERRQVMRWFYLGGAGFVLIVLGFALTAFGLLLAP